MKWTEQEFNNQRLDFINDVLLIKTEQQKTEQDNARINLNRKHGN